MHRPTVARLLPASALCGAALLAASACAAGRPATTGDAPGSAAAATRPAASAAPGAAALTAAQARAALLTEADMGAPWGPTQGAATWRDGVLKARTNLPQCQRLLDALYADQPLGAPVGPGAVAGFDDADDQSQMRYQVLSPHPADADRALSWLATLPRDCASFEATTTRSGTQNVQVADLGLPKIGDAGQGLRITFTATNAGEEAEEYDEGTGTTLVLVVAAVRVGDDAITLTDGALGAAPPDITAEAVQLGARRLTDVRQRARAQA
ncbi:hypothetical protein [Streptomyces sp. NPDC046985]|uniref:hypothetical protein n=1 Tax=Streptomyces sp. NPDC046985 TaxID=3155377 RepID=UPI0033F8CFFB